MGVASPSVMRGQCVHVLGKDRLLDEHQPQRIELAQQHLGHRPVHAPVEIDAQPGVRPDRLAHGRDRGDGRVDALPAVDHLHLVGAVHLQRREARIDQGPGGVGGIGRFVAADPGIDANAVAALPAQ